MKPTNDSVMFLPDDIVSLVVRLIRRHPTLGRGTCSSWEEVTPTDYEAAERVRALIEDGIVRVTDRSPAAIVRALAAAEGAFWLAS